MDHQKNSGKNIFPSSNNMHHHNGCLDNLFIDEQPAWLDELLNEPTPPKIMNKGHRRSASDTSAYLNSALMPSMEDNLLLMKKTSHASGPWQFQSNNLQDYLWQPHHSYGKQNGKMGWESPINTNGTNMQRHMSCGDLNRLSSSEKQVSKMKEGVSAKPEVPGSKTDAKRIKHQNAHRARLRRLEYISDLERTIQVLHIEGCEMSSAIHYLDQQFLMLSMENRALKQRIDSLAEIQKLKHVEQQLLEREIGNLQFRRRQQQQHPQKNQKQLEQVQQNRHKNYRQTNTQEPETQLAALTI